MTGVVKISVFAWTVRENSLLEVVLVVGDAVAVFPDISVDATATLYAVPGVKPVSVN